MIDLAGLGKLVQQKFPQYASRAADEIGDLVAKKFPQYQTKLVSPVPEQYVIENERENLADYKDALQAELTYPEETMRRNASVGIAPKGWTQQTPETTINIAQPQPTPQVLGKTSEWLPIPTPSPSPIAIPKRHNAQRPPTADYLESTVFPITRKYNIPDAVAAGMWAAEGRGKHKYGKAPYNNPFNINAVDENPNLAHRYKTEQEGVDAFAQLILRRYSDALKEKDPHSQLKVIQNKGYAGDPKTYKKRSDSGFAEYSEFIKSTPEFRYYGG